MAFERSLLEMVYSLVGANGFVDGVLMFCAQALAYLLTFAFLVRLLVHREPYERLTNIFYTTFALVLSSGVLQSILEFSVNRRSPAEALGFSGALLGYTGNFPAFATTWAATMTVVAYIALSRRLGLWLLLGALLVGFGQAYTSAQWPLDVLASFVIALAGALLARQFVPPAVRR